MPKTVLIVDDEKDIVEFLKYNLEQEGYQVFTAYTGKEALLQAERIPSLILLDVMMPELDGWETAKRLKENPVTKDVPIVFLTARTSESEEVAGLRMGADDYITKPISILKLLARIGKVINRGAALQLPLRILVADNFIIDIENYAVIVNGSNIALPKKEFETLLYLAQHPNKIISRDELLKNIWGADVVVGDRTVDVRIRKVREKLGVFADYIETIKGVGYRCNTN